MVTVPELEEELKGMQKTLDNIIRKADDIIGIVGKYSTSPRLNYDPLVREDAVRFGSYRDPHVSTGGPGPKPKEPDRRAYILDEKTVMFSDFKLPVKDRKTGEKVVDLINNPLKADHYKQLRKKYEEILIDYFSKKKRSARKAKSSVHPKEGLFEIIALLDNSYVLSNKVTAKLYKLDPYTFERSIRNSLENKSPAAKPEPQNDSYPQKCFWDKPITVKYNPKDGFKAENPDDLKRYSFLKEVLDSFLKEEKIIFDKLKKDTELTYVVRVQLAIDCFICCLEEGSVVRKAYDLSKELSELADDSKRLAFRIDSLTETSEEIFSKCDVKNIEEVLPLLEYAKIIYKFKFSKDGLQAYFFADQDYNPKLSGNTEHYCIFFGEDICPADSNSDPSIKMKYTGADRKRIEEVLYLLHKRKLILSDSKKLGDELKKIESEAFEQLATHARPKTDSERALRIKDVTLPQRWYDIRHLYYDWRFKSKEALPFVYPRRKSELVAEVLELLKNGNEKHD